MTPIIEKTLQIAGIGMAGIFLFMAVFYLLILVLDKLLPFQEERPVEELAAVEGTDEDYNDE